MPKQNQMLSWRLLALAGVILSGCGEPAAAPTPAEPAATPAAQTAPANPPATPPAVAKASNTEQLRGFVSTALDHLKAQDGEWVFTHLFVPSTMKGMDQEQIARESKQFFASDKAKSLQALLETIDQHPVTLSESTDVAWVWSADPQATTPEDILANRIYLWFFKVDGQWYVGKSSIATCDLPAELKAVPAPDFAHLPTGADTRTLLRARMTEALGHLKDNDAHWMFTEFLRPDDRPKFGGAEDAAKAEQKFITAGKAERLKQCLTLALQRALPVEMDAVEFRVELPETVGDGPGHLNFYLIDGQWYLGNH